MALHFPLKINDTYIGYFYARRVEGGGHPDDVNTYAVEVYSNGQKLWWGDVEHRYGDGGWKLVHKAIGQMLEELGDC